MIHEPESGRPYQWCPGRSRYGTEIMCECARVACAPRLFRGPSAGAVAAADGTGGTAVTAPAGAVRCGR